MPRRAILEIACNGRDIGVDNGVIQRSHPVARDFGHHSRKYKLIFRQVYCKTYPVSGINVEIGIHLHLTRTVDRRILMAFFSFFFFFVS